MQVFYLFLDDFLFVPGFLAVDIAERSSTVLCLFFFTGLSSSQESITMDLGSSVYAVRSVLSPGVVRMSSAVSSTTFQFLDLVMSGR